MGGGSLDPLTRPSCLTAVKVSRSLLYSLILRRKETFWPLKEQRWRREGGRKSLDLFFLALSGTRCGPTGLVSILPPPQE